MARISAEDNLSDKKLTYEHALVDGWTIYVASLSKKSGSRGSPQTIFVAKRLHKDNLCVILQRRIAKKLQQIGVSPLLPPQSFFVKGMQGPLGSEELDRAAKWALMLREKYEACQPHLVTR